MIAKQKRIDMCIRSKTSLFCAIVMAAGLVFLVVAATMNAHTDEVKAGQLTEIYERDYIQNTDEVRSELEMQVRALRTNKWLLFDVGINLLILGGAGIMAGTIFELRSAKAINQISTPVSRAKLLALMIVAWLALFPALIVQVKIDFLRDDLMPHSDTGNGIYWLIGPPFFLVGAGVIWSLGRFVALRKANFPANIWIWDSASPVRSWLHTILCGGTAILVLCAIGYALVEFPLATPSLLVILYVVLSSRAAILNRNYI